MATSFRKFLEGLRIIPKTTSTASEKGDLDVTDSSGKLNYHNGSTSSPVVTEDHSATLKNKTLDSASLINPTTVVANSSTDALRVTQTGTGNALVVEDSANPDATPFVVDASGRVGIGNASPLSPLYVGAGIVPFQLLDGAGAIFNPGVTVSTTSGAAGLSVGVSDGTNYRRLGLFVDQTNAIVGLSSSYGSGSFPFVYRDAVAERFRVTATGNFLLGTTANNARMVVAAEGTSAGVEAFNNGTSVAAGFRGRHSRGTAAAPTATQSGDTLVVLGGRGYGDTGYSTEDRAWIRLMTRQAWTDAAQGTQMQFYTTENDTTTTSVALTLYRALGAAYMSFPGAAGGVNTILQNDSTSSLQICGSTGSSGSSIHLFGTTHATTPNIIRFTTASGLERMRIASGGDVGIGTATPVVVYGRNLTVSGASSAGVTFESVGSSKSFGIGVGGTYFNIYDNTAAAERVRIDTSGNVGIGTSTPASILDVNGNVSVRSSNNAQTGSAVTLTAPTTSFVRLTAGVTSVAGITAGANGQTLTLSNRSGSVVSIGDEDAGATAANRIRTGSGAAFDLANNASIQLVYDSTTARWMVVGGVGGAGLVISVTAGEALSVNDAVYISVGAADGGRTAGRAYKLDATSDNRIEFIGFAVDSVSSGSLVRVQSGGKITGLSGLSVGKQVFASVATPGATQASSPTLAGQWVVPVGIATSASTLNINAAGSATAVKITSEADAFVYAAVTSVSADTTLTTGNTVVLVNASGGARTIMLPSPTSGKIVIIKKTDSSLNAVTISAPSGTIDGAASRSLLTQYDSLTIASDGTNFFII